jgi:hypothetical protein
VEEDDAVAERVGLGEVELDGGIRWLEQRLAPSDDDRVDVDPVLVDQVLALEGRGQVPSPDDEIPTGPASCSSGVALDELADPPD